MSIRIIQTILIAAATTLFVSCSEGGETVDHAKHEHNEGSEEKANKEFIQPLSKERQVFYALPSPFELASLLRHSGAHFEQEILNSAENVGNYSDTRTQAFNLGIYGADLSYSSIFGQTQSSMQYLTAVKRLTDHLGISAAFDGGTMERLELNKGNDDSLQRIVSDAYLIANSYLKEIDREHLSTMILVGGWIEGMFIATSLIDEQNENQDLIDMVAEQKFALENIVAMLQMYEGEEEYLAKLQSVHELFQVLEETQEAATIHKDENGKTVIGGNNSVHITAEQLKAITVKIAELRTEIVS